MSKQSLLEEFDKMFISDNYSYSTGNFNSSDPVVNKLKQFISKAIDKTREETIKEVEEMLPREKPMNTFSFALGGEELQLHMRFKGFNDCRGEVKDALNNLKQ